MRRFFPKNVFSTKFLLPVLFSLTILAVAAHAQNEPPALPDQTLSIPDPGTGPNSVVTTEEATPLLPDSVAAPAGDAASNPPALPIAIPQNADVAAAPVLPGGSAAPVLPGQEATPAIPDFFEDSNALAPEPMLNDPSAIANQGAQKSAEQLQTELQEDARKQAFDAALEGILPLRPDEIRQLLEQFDRTQESVELPVYPNPKPEVAVETISLDPGAKPAIVKVAYGNVTTLNVLDITGAPWPIEDVSWAGNFEIVEAGTGDGSHIIRISPQSEFATGNISIRLLTLKTPVILSIETSRDIVHYRFDAIIPEYGPFAEIPLIQKGMTTTAGNPTLTSILQGIAPQGASRLDVSGVDARTSAYALGGRTYIRTPLTLLSPSWSASVSSADGMSVYEVSPSPVLLLSDKGAMVRAKVAERQDILEGSSP